MKVILLKKVKGLGDEKKIVNVSTGYAQNFLLPKKLAALATPENISRMEKDEAEKKASEKIESSEAEKQRLIIENTELEFVLEEHMGKLVGSVTNVMIAERIKELLMIDIDKKKIELEKISTSGVYIAKIHFVQNIVANLRVAVVKKEG